MPRITAELIKKKSEHHDGLLADLEELSLHQLDLEAIDILGSVCKRLRILYLQSNLIGKIENLHKLKLLEYLNLTFNNITRIEGLSNCEKLNKLDLTLNHIDHDTLQESLESLQGNEHLHDFYLTGNPCEDEPADGEDDQKSEGKCSSSGIGAKDKHGYGKNERKKWEGLRPFVINILPQVKTFNGKEVTPTERINARRNFDEHLKQQKQFARIVALKKQQKKEKSSSGSDKGSDTYGYSVEDRMRMYHEQKAAEEEQKKKEKEAVADFEEQENAWDLAKKKLNERVTKPPEDGTLPSQRNPGRMEWRMYNRPPLFSKTFQGKSKSNPVSSSNDKSSDYKSMGVSPDWRHGWVLEVDVPKYLDTSSITVDVWPEWVQVIAKGNNLLLHTPSNVAADSSYTKRVTTTGQLQIILVPQDRMVVKSDESDHEENSDSKVPDGDSSSAPSKESTGSGLKALKGSDLLISQEAKARYGVEDTAKKTPNGVSDDPRDNLDGLDLDFDPDELPSLE